MSAREMTPPTRAALPTVVIASRDRRARLLETLARLVALPERPAIIVVDNGSADDTPAAVRSAFPGVRVIALEEDAGSAARTVGLRAARTPLVAFTDDDSWWAPGALARAATLFSAYPRLALLAARIHVEPGGRLDPTSATMRASPLRSDLALPGPPVLGFLACGAIARREAVLECGGFHPRFGFGGVDDVVAHHEPAPGRRTWSSGSEQRNVLWSAWLRRPLRHGARLTVAHAVRRRASGRRAVVAALGGLPWVIRERRLLPAHVEAHLRLLERAQA